MNTLAVSCGEGVLDERFLVGRPQSNGPGLSTMKSTDGGSEQLGSASDCYKP
jgi:hypothetical protein